MSYSLSYSPETKKRAAVLLELRRRREDRLAAFPRFSDWLADRFPLPWRWDWPYTLLMQQYLQGLIDGDYDRLMLFLPVRHGKSQMCSICFPAWFIAQNPANRVIIASYNQELAGVFSRKVRNIVRTEATVTFARDRDTTTEWETTDGGGLFAAGVGSGATGRGANLIVVDDPIKNREEANSFAYRQRAWEWLTESILTRREPGAITVLVTTRWHRDDPAGRILAGGNAKKWKVLRLPGIAETQEERDEYHRVEGLPVGEPDPIGREPGEALNPDRYPVEALEEMKLDLGAAFYPVIQQRATVAGGQKFKREWFEIVKGLPESPKRRLVRYWDKAGSQRQDSAYTAGVLIAEVEKVYYIVDMILGRWEAAERETVIKQTAAADYARYGADVWTVIEQEPGSGGLESAQNTIKNLAGYRVDRDRPAGDKVVRAEPVQVQASIGNVKLVEGPWNGQYLDILVDFPVGPFKDPVDATSGGFNYLRLKLKPKATAVSKPHVTRVDDLLT